MIMTVASTSRTGAPLPIIGIRGIRYLGKTIRKLASDQAKRETYLPLYLSHIVRMQEEIGTGGAGFRFMYAPFPRETAHAIGSDLPSEAAEMLAEAGDQWRMFALKSSKMCKGRSPMDGDELATLLNGCADQEAVTWQLLGRF